MVSSAAPAETEPTSGPTIVVAKGEQEQRVGVSLKAKSVMLTEPSVQSSGAPDQGPGVCPLAARVKEKLLSRWPGDH